jgi:hypothetical protein
MYIKMHSSALNSQQSVKIYFNSLNIKELTCPPPGTYPGGTDEGTKVKVVPMLN